MVPKSGLNAKITATQESTETETEKVVVYVGIGPMPGEIKTYQVELASTCGCGSDSRYHHTIQKSDLVNELRKLGADLRDGKFKFRLSYGNEHEIYLFSRGDFPDYIFHQVYIVTKS